MRNACTARHSGEVSKGDEPIGMQFDWCGPKEPCVIRRSRSTQKGEFLWGFALHQMRMTAKVNAVTDADVRRAVMRPVAKLLWTLVISAAATI